MGDLLGIGTLAAGVANSIVQGVGNKRNREMQMYINKYNAEQNAQNLSTQMAYNGASQISQRHYDSPKEQLARLTEAGVNAFTAQESLASDTGIGSGSISPSPSNAQAYQNNFNLDSLVNAVSAFENMKFTEGENDKNLKATADNLQKTLDNAVDLEDMRIKNSQVIQGNQFLHDLDVMAKQQEYHKDNEKSSYTFMKDFEETKNRLQKQLLKVGHENSIKILEKQNEFTKDENLKRREHEMKEWRYGHEYRKREYEHRKETDSQYYDYEADMKVAKWNYSAKKPNK